MRSNSLEMITWKYRHIFQFALDKKNSCSKNQMNLFGPNLESQQYSLINTQLICICRVSTFRDTFSVLVDRDINMGRNSRAIPKQIRDGAGLDTITCPCIGRTRDLDLQQLTGFVDKSVTVLRVCSLNGKKKIFLRLC